MARIDGMVDNAKDLINVIETATYEYGKCMKRTLQDAQDRINEIRKLMEPDTIDGNAILNELDNLEYLLVQVLET